MTDRLSPVAKPLLADALTQQLAEQQQRLLLLQGETSAPEQALEESLLEINVAHEELRVAQDELRAQQKAIDDLLGQQRHHGVWRERVSSLLPVPVFVTDSAGSVLDTNSVAAAILGVPESGLLRRPLISLVGEADRRPLRQLISQMSRYSEQQLVVDLKTRHGQPVQVTLAGFVDPRGPDEAHRYRWVAVPTGPATSDGAVEPPDASAAVFAKLCRLRVEDDDTRRLLGQVATLGMSAVPNAAGVSVSLGSPIEPEAIATESEFAQAVDGAQFDAGEGPCVDAYNSGRLVLSDNVPADTRWPIFASKGPAAGLLSALALPLQQGTDTIGVVNLYARTEAAFGPRDVRIAGLFAAAVSAVVQDVRERDSLRRLGQQLEAALESRAEIDQAKGIIMARHGCSADEAFARLVSVSRNTNTKLSALSARLVRAAQRPG